MTASFALTGGCHCGVVRYRVTAPARELCHCSICRRIHGAVFATFAIVERDRFTIEHGAERLTRYDSSSGAQRYFCSCRGGQIYSDVDSLPEIRFYTVGTLDAGAHPGHPSDVERHICVTSKIPWWPITDALPQSPDT